MRIPLLIAVATAMLCGSAGSSMAQNKLTKAQRLALAYKSCCDKAYGRFFIYRGRANCWADTEKTAQVYQCAQQHGFRPEHTGQITR